MNGASLKLCQSRKGPKRTLKTTAPSQIYVQHQKCLKKITMKCIQKLEQLNNIDITGENQHDFKKINEHHHSEFKSSP